MNNYLENIKNTYDAVLKIRNTDIPFCSNLFNAAFPLLERMLIPNKKDCVQKLMDMGLTPDDAEKIVPFIRNGNLSLSKKVLDLSIFDKENLLHYSDELVINVVGRIVKLFSFVESHDNYDDDNYIPFDADHAYVWISICLYLASIDMAAYPLGKGKMSDLQLFMTLINFSDQKALIENVGIKISQVISNAISYNGHIDDIIDNDETMIAVNQLHKISGNNDDFLIKDDKGRIICKEIEGLIFIKDVVDFSNIVHNNVSIHINTNRLLRSDEKVIYIIDPQLNDTLSVKPTDKSGYYKVLEYPYPVIYMSDDSNNPELYIGPGAS